MHRGAAAPGRQVLHGGVGFHLGRQAARQVANHMAQAVNLLLACDVAVSAAGELDVFLPPHHLQDGFGLGPGLMPHVHGKDQRIAPGVVVQHRFDRGVGVDAAVPVRLAVNAHRRKRGWQRARRQHMVQPQRLLAAVEVAHRAAVGIDGAHRQPGRARCQCVKVNQIGQRAGQRRGAVVRRLLDAQVGARAAQGGQAGLKKGRDAAQHRGDVGQRVAQAQPVQRAGEGVLQLDMAPERRQLVQPPIGPIAGDQRSVDGADRCADHPVRLDAGLVQRLVHPPLVGAQGAAALQHQHHLAGQLGLGVGGGLAAGVRPGCGLGRHGTWPGGRSGKRGGFGRCGHRAALSVRGGGGQGRQRDVEGRQHAPGCAWGRAGGRPVPWGVT